MGGGYEGERRRGRAVQASGEGESEDGMRAGTDPEGGQRATGGTRGGEGGVRCGEPSRDRASTVRRQPRRADGSGEPGDWAPTVRRAAIGPIAAAPAPAEAH
jgi:hypothetical protein